MASLHSKVLNFSILVFLYSPDCRILENSSFSRFPKKRTILPSMDGILVEYSPQTPPLFGVFQLRSLFHTVNHFVPFCTNLCKDIAISETGGRKETSV